MEYGYEAGEQCRRKGCKGIIAESEVENCSCHICPPCSRCTEDRAYCPECDWRGKDDIYENEYRVAVEWKTDTYVAWEPRKLDPNKIDWHNLPHTHFTMLKRGVYPEGTTQAQVEKEVRGTFGGRFNSFGNGHFEYVAYTD